jgi:predicted rRNA methylase YqxC with S4 and FtsJ domains
MTDLTPDAYVSRGGDKLAAALAAFDLDAAGRVCADFGSHVGGFVDCLLRFGAARVYAVDTCYGTLAWRLRRNPRVIVRERTNAMHVSLPEPVDLVTIDVGWTPQAKILPNVARTLGAMDPGIDVDSSHDLPPNMTTRIPVPRGSSPASKMCCAVTLVKPHYEAQAMTAATSQAERNSAGDGAAQTVPELVAGVLPDEEVDGVVAKVLQQIGSLGWVVEATFESPIRGHAGNREVFALLSHN